LEDPRVIYTALLKKVDAVIRADGLYVLKRRYMSADLRTSGLLERAAAQGPISAEATIDEFASRVVWYRVSLDSAWLPAYLADPKLQAYDATFAELSNYYRKRETVRQRTLIDGAARHVSIRDNLVQISDHAVELQGGKKAKPASKGKVKATRAVDANDERREHGAQIVASYLPEAAGQSTASPTDAEPPPIDPTTTDRLNLLLDSFRERSDTP
jgi:hypothetical protein